MAQPEDKAEKGTEAEKGTVPFFFAMPQFAERAVSEKGDCPLFCGPGEI